jgi:MFS family permease
LLASSDSRYTGQHADVLFLKLLTIKMTTEPDADPDGETFHGSLAPLNIPDYRRLLASNTLWWMAMWMELIVVGWLVLEMTDSAWQLALIGFYRMAPLLVLGLYAGPLCDRIGRRTIIIYSQVINLGVNATIACLLWTDQLTIWQLSVGATVMGITWALDWTARRSFLPDLVGRAGTMDAMLLEGFTQNVTRILGPFSSGALIAALGATGCYFTLTGTSILSLCFLVRLSKRRISPPDPKASSSPIKVVIEGLQYIRHSPSILGVLLITVILNFLAFPYMTLLPVFARDILNQGPIGLGLLGTANGVGAFIGLFVVRGFRRSKRMTWVYGLGSIFMSLALVGFALSTQFYLSVILLVIGGVGQACFGILQSSIVLLCARDDMRSRAMGAIVLGIGTGPPGRLNTGALAEAFSAPFSLALTCGLAAILVLVVIVSLPGFRRAEGLEIS